MSASASGGRTGRESRKVPGGTAGSAAGWSSRWCVWQWWRTASRSPEVCRRSRSCHLWVFNLHAHPRVVETVSVASHGQRLRHCEVCACFSACKGTGFVQVSQGPSEVWLAAQTCAILWRGRASPPFWSGVRPFIWESKCRVPFLQRSDMVSAIQISTHSALNSCPQCSRDRYVVFLGQPLHFREAFGRVLGRA